MYTATQGAFVYDSHPVGGEKQSTLQCWADIQVHISWGTEKQNKRGKWACKHTLDRVPNHATVRIRQMQEGGQENA